MTDRRIDRSVTSHLAALDARVRALETLLGGGVSSKIKDEAIATLGTITLLTYQDLATVGPQVTVTIGKVGVVQLLVTATPWPNVDNPDNLSEARIALEMSGANVMDAATWEATYGYIASGVQQGVAATETITVIESVHRGWIIRGLTPGETTFKMKYRKAFAGNNINCDQRHLLAAPF